MLHRNDAAQKSGAPPKTCACPPHRRRNVPCLEGVHEPRPV
ncbi:hypothetical protein U91I_00946 [alpha proteobacterium U9-1i]|nr:hypothetical protein U91I_00946 [alpha proteobacterium U9-1i]